MSIPVETIISIILVSIGAVSGVLLYNLTKKYYLIKTIVCLVILTLSSLFLGAFAQYVYCYGVEYLTLESYVQISILVLIVIGTVYLLLYETKNLHEKYRRTYLHGNTR